MKKLLALCLAFCSITALYAQEFTMHNNGLIYSEKTMSQLNRIVDSLNLKFKVCSPTDHFTTFPQAKGYCIYMDSLADAARADIDGGISYTAFAQKYPFAISKDQSLIVGFVENDSEEKKYIELKLYPSEDDRSLPFEADFFQKPHMGKWVTKYYPKSEYRETPGFWAAWFTTDFRSAPFAERYARDIQYSECMIDTTTTTYLSDDYDSYWYDDDQKSKKQTPAQDTFWTWYKSLPGTLDNDKPVRTDPEKHQKTVRLLRAAYDECVFQKKADFRIEGLAGQYLGQTEKLTMMRLRRVMGSCSQDDSPRRHAIGICQLAAETATWEVFLRSHLDVMNDRFARASDGSYAWGRRGTYLHELEELGIDVPTLMIGISLRSNGIAENHYFGNIGRVGRALAESRELEQVESRLERYIADTALDDFNRMVLFNLYHTIQYYKISQKKGIEEKEQEALVEAAVKPVRQSCRLIYKPINRSLFVKTQMSVNLAQLKQK